MINDNSLSGVAALLDAVAVALASPLHTAARATPQAPAAVQSSTGDDVECSWVKSC